MIMVILLINIMHTTIYIYIYMYKCVCVCVCAGVPPLGGTLVSRHVRRHLGSPPFGGGEAIFPRGVSPRGTARACAHARSPWAMAPPPTLPHYFNEYRLEFFGGVFSRLGLVSNTAGAVAASALSSLVSDLAGRRVVAGSPVNNQVGSPQLPRLRLGRMM